MSVSYAGNGRFDVTVDGKTQSLSMADLNTMLRIEQVESMDQSIADQLTEIRETNQKRKALNELMAKMRQSKSEGKDDEGAYALPDFTLPGESGSKNVEQWMAHFGINETDVKGRKHSKSSDEEKQAIDTAWDANIEAVKGTIDNITSDSELQMLRFRQMVDKRGTALQEAKTTLQNDKRLKDAIIQS